jgi:hypothetical protein
MTYKTRIGILIGFIILFFITAPVVVLYTAGYRWNEKKVRLEKVGIIFLRSHPSGADIYLDGKLRSEHTSARLRNLLPSTYEVKVTKDGYSDWKKDLPVSSAKTTFAEGIVLWKVAQPEAVATSLAYALNKNEQAVLEREDPLVYEADGEIFKSNGFEIWVENKNGDHETVTRLSEEIKAILPYTNTGWVIYETAASIHAIERDERDTRNDIVLATGDNLNGLALSSDGKYLYYTVNKNGVAPLWRRALQ